MSQGWCSSLEKPGEDWMLVNPGNMNINKHHGHNAEYQYEAIRKWIPLTDMYLEENKQRALLLFKTKVEKNKTKWVNLRPVPHIQAEAKFKNTNYNNCKHDISCLLRPMYLIQFVKDSTRKLIGMPQFFAAHDKCHKHINKWMENNTICKVCAMKLLLKTQCFTKLIQTSRYIMLYSVPDSLRFMHLFYSALIMIFTFHHPNIMRFVFKELSVSLQVYIVEFIIFIQMHLHYFMIQQFEKKDKFFLYSFHEWFMIRNVFTNLLLKSYKYWYKDFKVFDDDIDDIGEYVIDAAVENLKWIMKSPQVSAMQSMTYYLFWDACLLSQCMEFDRKMITTVYELFKEYQQKFKNKYVKHFTEMMQCLLLMCNHTEYAIEHRKDCKEYVMKISKKHIRKYTYCQRNDCANRRKRKLGKQLKLCSGCCSVYYCSKRCQKKAWKRRHKKQCNKLKSFKKINVL